MMQRSEKKKPLRELSNVYNNPNANFGSKNPRNISTSKSVNANKKKNTDYTKSKPLSSSVAISDEKSEMEPSQSDPEVAGVEYWSADFLDRLLLVQSDLSNLTHQVDELIAQAFKINKTSKKGRNEVEAFMQFLSEILSSLKPWVPRLKDALTELPEETKIEEQSLMVIGSPDGDDDEIIQIGSPEKLKFNSLISPSPLVSWRANCTVERGRQVFMLTPLPISKSLSSKNQESSKSVIDKKSSATAPQPSSLINLQETGTDFVKDVEKRPCLLQPPNAVTQQNDSNTELGLTSTPAISKRDCSMVVTTPYFKVSPPKSCMLLEPPSGSSRWGNYRIRKSTPFPTGMHNHNISESSSGEDSEGLATKYPELMGIHLACELGIVKKDEAASPDWFVSPPKSCVLMQPPEVKPHNVQATRCQPTPAPLFVQAANSSILQQNSTLDSSQKMDKSGLHPTSFAVIQCTPTCKEPASTIQRGKHPGETTLKKELWTKFEAASTYGFQLKGSTLLENNGKGFLDRLDEVSLDESETLS